MSNTVMTHLGLAMFLAFGIGCDSPVENHPDTSRDLAAGPVTEWSLNEIPWCEELDSSDAVIDEQRGQCMFKYLRGGMKYWLRWESVGFVADVSPACDSGVESYCIPNPRGHDCIAICRFAIRNVSRVIFGDPDTINSIGSFSPEDATIDGTSTQIYHVDGTYPAGWWTVSPGRNLVFAHRACFAERYTGDSQLFYIAGIYPVVGEVVYDADQETIPLEDLESMVEASGTVVDESARYEERCGLSGP